MFLSWNAKDEIYFSISFFFFNLNVIVACIRYTTKDNIKSAYCNARANAHEKSSQKFITWFWAHILKSSMPYTCSALQQALGYIGTSGVRVCFVTSVVTVGWAITLVYFLYTRHSTGLTGEVAGRALLSSTTFIVKINYRTGKYTI